MADIATLEVGDTATPVVDVIYNDPLTEVDYTLPSKGAAGTVQSRTQVGLDLETDTPIYDYSVLFSPALETTETIPADPEDPESEEYEKTFTVSVLTLDIYELGLAVDDEQIVDADAIQQEINTAKQISQSSLNTAQGINQQIQSDTSDIETYGRAEIENVVAKMEGHDEDLQTRDVIGMEEEELVRSAQENKVSADLISSDQQIMLEYVDNTFALRDVLKTTKTEMYESQQQSQTQTVRGLEEDQQNADAFHSQYLATSEAQNAFTNPEDFNYPTEERDEALYPDLSEIATLMQSSLLNPESTPNTVSITPDDSTSEPVNETTEFEPIVPPGVNEEDL
jgi:hypothetical protein